MHGSEADIHFAHATEPLGHGLPRSVSGSCRVPQRSPWSALFPPPPPPRRRPSLFGSFIGTTAQSDSSTAYMSGLRQIAFPDRSRISRDAMEVSRFSCMLFLNVLGSLTTPGPAFSSRLALSPVLPSRHSQGVGARILGFRSSIAQPINASVYASPTASRRPTQDSRSGWSRCSFPVGLLHPLQHAGLSRRTAVPLPVITDACRARLVQPEETCRGIVRNRRV